MLQGSQWLKFRNAAVALALVCAPVSGKENPDAEHLIQLNAHILSAYVLQNDTGPLDAHALPEFFVITPGGIESRDRVIATVANVQASGFEIAHHSIVFYGDTALLTATMTLDGTIVGRRQPPLSMLTVFVKVDGEWKLAARSLTPHMARPSERPQ